jgi:hemerythrin-like domain-containing protein
MSKKEALALLEQEHGEIRTLVRQFEKAGERGKEQLVKRIFAIALSARLHRGVASL